MSNTLPKIGEIPTVHKQAIQMRVMTLNPMNLKIEYFCRLLRRARLAENTKPVVTKEIIEAIKSTKKPWWAPWSSDEIGCSVINIMNMHKGNTDAANVVRTLALQYLG